MSVKVSFDMTEPVQKLRTAARKKTFGLAVAKIAREGMRKYIPVDTGRMRRTAEAKPFKVVYAPQKNGKHYAYYPYSGKHGHIHTDKNPNATAKWPEAYISKHRKEFATHVAIAFRKELRR